MSLYRRNRKVSADRANSDNDDLFGSDYPMWLLSFLPVSLWPTTRGKGEKCLCCSKLTASLLELDAEPSVRRNVEKLCVGFFWSFMRTHNVRVIGPLDRSKRGHRYQYRITWSTNWHKASVGPCFCCCLEVGLDNYSQLFGVTATCIALDPAWATAHLAIFFEVDLHLWKDSKSVGSYCSKDQFTTHGPNILLGEHTIDFVLIPRKHYSFSQSTKQLEHH